MTNPILKFFLVSALFIALFSGCGVSDRGGDYSPSLSSEADGAVTITAPSAPGGNGPSSGLITAGEWNDLANWQFWMNLQQNQTYATDLNRWGFEFASRVSVRVASPGNSPKHDAVVKLFYGSKLLYTAHTDQDGMAELFTDLYGDELPQQFDADDLLLQIDGVRHQGTVKLMSEGINYCSTDANRQFSRTELAFLVDATGSMGDELNFLKEDLRNVIQRIETANGNLDVATATVFYRDEGDDYVTRHSNFTQDISETIDFIGRQSANGGGDFPEAVQSALRVAVNDLQWSSNARTRIAFLLLDAPPHEDRQVMDEYRALVKSAAAKGIRIVPVTASGIDKATEFLMRQTAIATNGTYVFITNDSGIGNDHIEATVGDYEVEYLNDLLVRLVGEYTE
ncbi:MAG: VWA domain-containing protein [Lewinella sp.]